MGVEVEGVGVARGGFEVDEEFTIAHAAEVNTCGTVVGFPFTQDTKQILEGGTQADVKEEGGGLTMTSNCSTRR